MAIFTTSGILLRSMNYRETSKIFRFLTLDHGLTSLIAKGVRQKRRYGGEGLELFSRGEITFYAKGTGDLHLFKEFSLKKTGRTLAGNIFQFTAASVLGEIVLIQGTNERSPEVFDKLKVGLDNLENASVQLAIPILLKEAWSLVVTLGYRPEISNCINCATPLDKEEIGKFDLQEGGILCYSCGSTSVGPRLGPIARKQLNSFIANANVETVRGAKGHITLLRDFIGFHLTERGKLNSFDFLISLLENIPSEKIVEKENM